jgi:hypothetical protein
MAGMRGLIDWLKDKLKIASSSRASEGTVANAAQTQPHLVHASQTTSESQRSSATDGTEPTNHVAPPSKERVSTNHTPPPTRGLERKIESHKQKTKRLERKMDLFNQQSKRLSGQKFSMLIYGIEPMRCYEPEISPLLRNMRRS